MNHDVGVKVLYVRRANRRRKAMDAAARRALVPTLAAAARMALGARGGGRS